MTPTEINIAFTKDELVLLMAYFTADIECIAENEPELMDVAASIRLKLSLAINP